MTTCRCCNHPMDTQEQPALVPGRAPSQLVTCWNSFCPLYGYTFTAEGYAYVDLTTYCPDAPIDEATQQMQARVARITERMALFGQSGADAPCGENGIDTPRIVYFLQNAWSPIYAGAVWPRERWLLALKSSRSGQRLRVMLDDFDLCENTTPQVGATPDSVLPPDDAHILAVLEARRPTVVVACGKQAETALARLWNGALLAVPHPAHRLLTDALYCEARRQLSDAFTARIAIRQQKGSLNIVALATTAQEPQIGVSGSDAHDGDAGAVAGTVAAVSDGTPLDAMQQTLYARFGTVIEPLPPTQRGRTDGERRALAHAAEKRAQAAGIVDAREWRRALGV